MNIHAAQRNFYISMPTVTVFQQYTHTHTHTLSLSLSLSLSVECGT